MKKETTKRIAITSLWVFVSCSLFSWSGPLTTDSSLQAKESALVDEDPTTRPYVDGDAASGSSASGQAAKVNYKYTKKVSYKKIRKKLMGKKTHTFLFSDVSTTSSRLTHFGFYYHTWMIAHTGYGDMNEMIMLYPVINASKDGSSSKLSLGIRLESYIQILNTTSRKYKKMILSGGGKKITISGSTKTRMKIVGQYVKRKYMTKGTFTLSSTKNVREARIEKLKHILSAKNTKITVKDTAKGKTYKCYIDDTNAANMKKLITKYESLLKNYRKKK